MFRSWRSLTGAVFGFVVVVVEFAFVGGTELGEKKEQEEAKVVGWGEKGRR